MKKKRIILKLIEKRILIFIKYFYINFKEDFVIFQGSTLSPSSGESLKDIYPPELELKVRDSGKSRNLP